MKILRAKLRGDRTAVQRFLREAEYGSRVAHPAVVQTYEFGEAPGGLHYLALEWADGEILAKFVRRSGPVALALSATIVRHVADGLAAAHAPASFTGTSSPRTSSTTRARSGRGCSTSGSPGMRSSRQPNG